MQRWIQGGVCLLIVLATTAQIGVPIVSAPQTTWTGARSVRVAWTVTGGHGRRVPVTTNGVVVVRDWQDTDAPQATLLIDMDACTGAARVAFAPYRRSCAWLPMVRRP